MSSLFDLTGKVAVVTGSSKGIGRAIVERMAEHGAKVVVSSRKADVCEQVAAGILRSLRKNRTETVLGREASWILRINRFFPRLLDRLMARRVRSLYASDPAPT